MTSANWKSRSAAANKIEKKRREENEKWVIAHSVHLKSNFHVQGTVAHCRSNHLTAIFFSSIYAFAVTILSIHLFSLSFVNFTLHPFTQCVRFVLRRHTVGEPHDKIGIRPLSYWKWNAGKKGDEVERNERRRTNRTQNAFDEKLYGAKFTDSHLNSLHFLVGTQLDLSPEAWIRFPFHLLARRAHNN